MKSKPQSGSKSDFTGCRVLILKGTYKGSEAVCVGRSNEGQKWAISPDNTNAILQLKFDEEFALLVDLSGKAEAN